MAAKTSQNHYYHHDIEFVIVGLIPGKVIEVEIINDGGKIT